jgi:hypothetical protein
MISEEYGTGWSPPEDSPNLRAELAWAKEQIGLLEEQVTCALGVIRRMERDRDDALQFAMFANATKDELIKLVDRALTDYNLGGEIDPDTFEALAIAVERNQQ